MSSLALKRKKKARMLRLRLHKIGYVDIDSGTIMIADPGAAHGVMKDKDWPAVCRLLDEKTGEPGTPPHPGKFCGGVATPTHYGDGRFPVLAVFAAGCRRPRYLLVDMDDQSSKSIITLTRPIR